MKALHYAVVRRVLAGQFVNAAGDAAANVALPLFLVDRPDAAFAISLLFGTIALCTIACLLVGGALADRLPRSMLLLWSDVLRASGIVVIVALGNTLPIGVLIVAAAFIGCGSGLYGPAFTALLPALIAADAHAAANAARSIVRRLAAIAGSAIAAVAVARAGAGPTLIADSLTFIVSIASVWRLPDRLENRRARAPLGADIRAGFTFVLHHRWMSAVMLQGMTQLALVSAPIAVLLPLYATAHGWSGLYGYALAAESLGAVIGAAAAARVVTAKPGLIALLGLGLQLPQILVLATSQAAWLLIPCSTLGGFGGALFGVLWMSALQANSPRHLLGRVVSIDAFANNALMPLGYALTGFLLPALHFSIVARFAAATLVISLIAVMPVPGVARFAAPRGHSPASA